MVLKILVAVDVCETTITVDFGFQDGDDLPTTGFSVSDFVGPGVLLLLLGAALVLVSGRRRPIED